MCKRKKYTGKYKFPFLVNNVNEVNSFLDYLEKSTIHEKDYIILYLDLIH